MSPLYFFFLPFLVTASQVFIFSENVNVASSNNWHGHQPPCPNDRIRTDAMSEIVMMIDQDFQFSKLELPDNGVVFLEKATTVNEKGEWQTCQRDGADDAFFAPQRPFLSLRAPSAWVIAGDKPTLHMNMVPGEHDDVLIFPATAVQLSIDDPITVRRLNFSGREMFTADFTDFLKTLEGQFQVQLGHRVGREKDRAGLALQQPIGDPLTVTGQTEAHDDDGAGIRNPNGQNETMREMCEYVHCAHPRCVDTVRPYGHCCDECGALLSFYSSQLDVPAMRGELVRIVERAGLFEKVGVSLERIDDGSLAAAQYEISYLPISMFDADVFADLIEETERKLYSRHTNMQILGAHKTLSTSIRHHTAGSTIVSGVLCLIVLIAIVGYAVGNKQYRTNPRFRMWLRAAPSHALVSVVWKGGKEGDDIVQLVQDVPADEQLASELEEPPAAGDTPSPTACHHTDEIKLIEF